jgi:hypothetical protein
MTLYARGDIQSVTVTGGCGKSHRRPVVKGTPVKIFELDCPPCEHHINGGDQLDVLEFKFKHDKNGDLITDGRGHAIQEGINRVRPRDPNWSASPADLPMTGAERIAVMREQERREHEQEERSKRAEDLRTFSALMNIPGADPRKLAENLGIDLTALGLDEDTPRPRKPRVVKE